MKELKNSVGDILLLSGMQLLVFAVILFILRYKFTLTYFKFFRSMVLFGLVLYALFVTTKLNLPEKVRSHVLRYGISLVLLYVLVVWHPAIGSSLTVKALLLAILIFIGYEFS